jgi:hypothetical protein
MLPVAHGLIRLQTDLFRIARCTQGNMVAGSGANTLVARPAKQGMAATK